MFTWRARRNKINREKACKIKVPAHLRIEIHCSHGKLAIKINREKACKIKVQANLRIEIHCSHGGLAESRSTERKLV